jgi:lipoyl(octanoyl) transferase
MNIEIKKSIKPIKYNFAIKHMEKRLDQISKGGSRELIWILEHEEIYTGGTSYKDNEILDKSINFIKTNRGGKITFHGPGQLIFYFIIDLKKRKINIRKLISLIEKTIIDTLSYFKINTFADRKNIGIWYKNNKDKEKVAAIGIKVKKWIAYHGFSVNINNDLKKYEKIIPCGIKEKKITNLNKIKKQNYKIIKDLLIKNFLTNILN